MKIRGEKDEYVQEFLDTPNYLMIEPTNRCNLNCKMCSRNELTDIGDIEFDLFKDIVAQLPELKTVKFQGLGEAYLARDAVRMLEYLKERNIGVVSITNAIWRNIDIPHLMTLLDHMYISYHAANLEVWEKIVGAGQSAWELLHKNIETIVANQQQCKVVFNCVLSSLNVWQAEAVVNHAAENGVKNVRFQIMQNWTAQEEELHQSLESIAIDSDDLNDFVESLSKAFKRADELGVAVELVGNDEFDYTKCVWPFERTYINKNGDVLPCHMRPHPRYSIGNVRHESFSDIWNNSKKMIEIREKLSRNEAPEMCRQCPYAVAIPTLKYVRAQLMRDSERNNTL